MQFQNRDMTFLQSSENCFLTVETEINILVDERLRANISSSIKQRSFPFVK